jgi:hypothetical protein
MVCRRYFSEKALSLGITSVTLWLVMRGLLMAADCSCGRLNGCIQTKGADCEVCPFSFFHPAFNCKCP